MKTTQTVVEEGWLSYSHITENPPDWSVNQMLHRVFSSHSDFKGVVFNLSSGGLHYDVKLKLEIPGFEGFYHTPADVIMLGPEIEDGRIVRILKAKTKFGEAEIYQLYQEIYEKTSSCSMDNNKSLILFTKKKGIKDEIPFRFQ